MKPINSLIYTAGFGFTFFSSSLLTSNATEKASEHSSTQAPSATKSEKYGKNSEGSIHWGRLAPEYSTSSSGVSELSRLINHTTL